MRIDHFNYKKPIKLILFFDFGSSKKTRMNLERQFCQERNYTTGVGRQNQNGIFDSEYGVPSHRIPLENNFLEMTEYNCNGFTTVVFTISNEGDSEANRAFQNAFIENFAKKTVVDKYLSKNPVKEQSFAQALGRKEKIKGTTRTIIEKLEFGEAKNLILWLTQFAPAFFKTYKRFLDCYIRIKKCYDGGNPRPSEIPFYHGFYQADGWTCQDVLTLVTMIKTQLPKYQMAGYHQRPITFYINAINIGLPRNYLWTPTQLIVPDEAELLEGYHSRPVEEQIRNPEIPTLNQQLIREAEVKFEKLKKLVEKNRGKILIDDYKPEFSKIFPLPRELIDIIFDMLSPIDKEQMIFDLRTKFLKKLDKQLKTGQVLSPEKMFPLIEKYLECFDNQVFKCSLEEIKNEIENAGKNGNSNTKKIEKPTTPYLVNIHRFYKHK